MSIYVALSPTKPGVLTTQVCCYRCKSSWSVQVLISGPKSATTCEPYANQAKTGLTSYLYLSLLKTSQHYCVNKWIQWCYNFVKRLVETLFYKLLDYPFEMLVLELLVWHLHVLSDLGLFLTPQWCEHEK